MGRYERLNGLLIIRRARKISFFWFSAGVSWAARTCDGNSKIDVDVVLFTCAVVYMRKPADSLSDKK